MLLLLSSAALVRSHFALSFGWPDSGTNELLLLLLLQHPESKNAEVERGTCETLEQTVASRALERECQQQRHKLRARRGMPVKGLVGAESAFSSSGGSRVCALFFLPFIVLPCRGSCCDEASLWFSSAWHSLASWMCFLRCKRPAFGRKALFFFSLCPARNHCSARLKNAPLYCDAKSSRCLLLGLELFIPC